MAKRQILSSASQYNLSVPQAEGPAKVPSPKIDQIATSIQSLTILEVAELSDLLKKRLNLPDAPMMAMGGFAAPAAAAPAEVFFF